jgi:succinate dehydrogenase / fumarate reductase cytochrome b subunit
VSSIGYKIAMAVTGLFLCLFLVVHLAGNLQLFLPAPQGQLQFNAYSKLLGGNPIIRIASIVTTASIVAHSALALVLNRRNRGARATRYARERAGETSPWYARWMGVLGLVILLFLVVHLRTFWVPFKFGEVGVDAAGNKDLHGMVTEAFASGWYTLLYVVCMAAVAFHLLHGVESSLRTIGLHHRRYVIWLRRLGMAFAIGIGTGFAVIPVYIYATQ